MPQLGACFCQGLPSFDGPLLPLFRLLLLAQTGDLVEQAPVVRRRRRQMVSPLDCSPGTRPK